MWAKMFPFCFGVWMSVYSNLQVLEASIHDTHKIRE
jgi:hypothetical protein